MKSTIEEAGHHLETMLKTSDTQGDEGEMSRRPMADEKLSAAQIQSIRSENDMGTIPVDGKQIEIEFDLFSSIGKGLEKVGEVVVDGAVGMSMDDLRGGARNLTVDEVLDLHCAWREDKGEISGGCPTKFSALRSRGERRTSNSTGCKAGNRVV